MTRYRDELGALRGRKEALDEQVRDMRAELEKKEAEIDRLRKRMAGSEDGAGREQEREIERKDAEITRLERKLVQQMPADEIEELRNLVGHPPRAGHLKPGISCKLVYSLVVCVLGVIAGLVVVAVRGVHAFEGWLAALGCAAMVFGLSRQFDSKHYLGCTRKGLTISTRAGAIELRWAEVGELRVVEHGRGMAGIKIRDRSTNEWRSAGSGWPKVERTIAAIDAWKRYDRARRLVARSKK